MTTTFDPLAAMKASVDYIKATYSVKTFETRHLASTTVYPDNWTGPRPQRGPASVGKTWGPFFWGSGEFGYWAGVDVKLSWPLWLCARSQWIDDHHLPYGQYSIEHHHS